MNTMETERTIDLRILFFRVLKRWRLLLLFLVLGGLLGAAFGFLQVRKASKNSAKAVQEYEAQKAVYEQAVRDARNAVDFYQAYLGGTLLSQLDPNCVPTSEARLFASATAIDEESPNAATIVTNGIRYILFNIDSSLESADCFSKISEMTGVEDRFLRELISITANSSAGIIDIVVNYTDLETAEAIRDLILNYSEEVSKDLKPEGIASYKVDIFKGYSGMSVSSEISTLKNNFPKNLSTLKTNLTTAETNLSGLSAPKAYGRKAKLIEILKYGVLFGAVFFLLGAALTALKLLFPWKILSSEDAEQSTCLPVFTNYGSLTMKHKTRFDRWILRRLEGKTFDLDTDGHSSIIKVAVETSLTENDTLYLISTADDSGAEMIKESLQKNLDGKKVELVKGVLEDPCKLSSVENGAPVILVEKLERTAKKSVAEEIQYLKGRDASLKGCIVYE